METVNVKELKKELAKKSHHEIIDLCLQLSKFKLENKELLTYLLFESSDETGYVNSIKDDIDKQFNSINNKTVYWTKKGVRKILKNTKKFIRYSKNKETEIELLFYYCERLMNFIPLINYNKTLINIYNREIDSIKKKVLHLHEDLQYDYKLKLNTLNTFN